MQARSRSVGRRAWTALSGLAALALVLSFATPDARTLGLWLLGFCGVMGFSIFVVLQPGMFLYAHGRNVGIHTPLGSRYEVPDDAVSVLRVGPLPFWGVLAEGVSLESADGRRLFVHANARYADEDLQALAERIGANVIEE
jgi:hypothetical protein